MTSQSQAIFANDDDPRITYSGEWNVVESWKDPSPANREFGSTAHVTSQQGASATFRFQGDGVRFFISLPAVTGDRNAVVNLVVRLDGESTETRTFGRGTLLVQAAPFVKEGLDPLRVHELVVTYQGQAEFADPLPFRFDGIRWTIPASGSSSSPNAPAPPQQSAAPPPPASSNNALSNLPSPDSSSTPQVVQDSEPSRSRVVDSSSTHSAVDGALTSADERVVTKILPHDRLTTLTDSTGGITVRTESALSSGEPKSAQLSVGPVVAIVISTLIVLLLICLGGVLGWRRRRARRGVLYKSATPHDEPDFHDGLFVSQRSLPSPVASIRTSQYPVVYQKERLYTQNRASEIETAATWIGARDVAPPTYTYSIDSSVPEPSRIPLHRTM